MRNFKAEEEALDQWFDEKKHYYEEQYVKELLSRYGEKPKKVDWQKSAETYRANINKVRQKYQEKYSKIRSAEEHHITKKKAEKKVLNFLSPLIRLALYLHPKNLKPILEGMKKVLHNFSFWASSKIYYFKEFLRFKIRPHLLPAYRIFIKRPMIKARPQKKFEFLKEKVKLTIKNSREAVSYVIETAKKFYEFLLKILETIKKFFAGISEKIKKVKSYFKDNYYTPIAGLFKKNA